MTPFTSIRTQQEYSRKTWIEIPLKKPCVLMILEDISIISMDTLDMSMILVKIIQSTQAQQPKFISQSLPQEITTMTLLLQ